MEKMQNKFKTLLTLCKILITFVEKNSMNNKELKSLIDRHFGGVGDFTKAFAEACGGLGIKPIAFHQTVNGQLAGTRKIGNGYACAYRLFFAPLERKAARKKKQATN